MPLRSMTGFGRADGGAGDVRFHWEVRSVNSRGLDVRLRLPSGCEALEPAARELIGKSVVRGNVSATLTLDASSTGGEIRINERALATILAAVERLSARTEFDRARPEGVLALRGVLETGEGRQLELSEMQPPLLEGLMEAVGGLVAARQHEGGALERVLDESVSRIETLVAQIEALPVRSAEAVRARLGEQVQKLFETGATMDQDRLHQEAMLLATRADVEEEIKRLGAHIVAARKLLAESQPVGRRLDFLTQEFNREANTICSKSIDIEMTNLGLELKAVIDQVREQVQNIE